MSASLALSSVETTITVTIYPARITRPLSPTDPTDDVRDTVFESGGGPDQAPELSLPDLLQPVRTGGVLRVRTRERQGMFGLVSELLPDPSSRIPNLQ